MGIKDSVSSRECRSNVRAIHEKMGMIRDDLKEDIKDIKENHLQHIQKNLEGISSIITSLKVSVANSAKRLDRIEFKIATFVAIISLLIQLAFGVILKWL